VREFFSELFLFIYSTLSHWQALVSGGVITALIAVFERLSGYHLKKKTYMGLFVGVFLLVAFFMSWREERERGLAAEKDANTVREESKRARKPLLSANITQVMVAARKEDGKPIVTMFAGN
jgi:Na+/melibiose symporter-like transporter